MQPVIHCKYDKIMKARDVEKIFNPRNPNKHSTEQLIEIKKILEYQGIREAFRINKDTGLLNVGHGRTMSGLEENWDIPVVFQKYENEAQAYADMVADNALPKLADLDLKQIKADALDLGPALNLDLLGLPEFKIEPIKLDAEKPREEKAVKTCPACGEELP